MMHRRVSRRTLFAAPLVAAPRLLFGAPAKAAAGDFNAFLSAVRSEAAAQGIRLSTVDLVLRGAQYLPHVIELDRHQPEQVLTFAQYLAKTVSAGRIENARRQLVDNRILLDAVWRRYNVEPRFIVALWGLESDFGAITGNYLVVSSLATLGFDGRRGPYFRGELISALRIIDQGNVAPENMTGSWAGAMGQCQFMPSSFLSYAVDYDGDGRRDIWNDRADVLASIANYLQKMGWRQHLPWGFEVVVPQEFGYRLSRGTFAEWSQRGLRRADGGALPGAGNAILFFPSGAVYPIESFPPWLRAFAQYNPETHAVSALKSILFKGANFAAISSWRQDS